MRDRRDYRRRRRPSLVWPVILVTVGALLLLNNLNLLDVNLWQLWRFWPVLIILAGLEILLGRRSLLWNLAIVLVAVLIVAGVVVLLVARPDVLEPSVSGEMVIAEPLEGVEQAELQVSFGAGELTIGQLVDSLSLIEGELDLATSVRPTWTIERSGDRASMTLGYSQGVGFKGPGKSDNWRLRLSPQASFSLDVDVGAGVVTLDLTGLDIRELKVEGGVGQTTVTFPKQGNISAQVSSGLGALTLEIPEEMAARLRVDRGLSALSVSGRFKKDGADYVTDDWATSENRLDLGISVGIGAVTVREP